MVPEKLKGGKGKKPFPLLLLANMSTSGFIDINLDAPLTRNYNVPTKLEVLQ